MSTPSPPRTGAGLAAPTAPTAATVAATATAIAIVAVAALGPASVRADWSGGVEGGATIGEDDGTLLRATLTEDGRPLTHSLFADWVRRGDAGDAWRIGYVPRYWFAPRLYGFAEGQLRGDGALGIDVEARALAGVGARGALGAGVSGYAEVGVGAVRTDFDDPCDDVDPLAGGPCAGAGADDDVETGALGVLRAGASATLAERVRLSLDADAERRADASELRAEAGAALRAGAGSLSVTLRTRRLIRDGAEAASATETVVGYSFGF